MLKVPLPELKKQRRVAAILDQAEALRAKYHQFLTRIDDLADSLFREMFGAKEWPRRPLCSLCTMEVGFPFSSSSFLSPGKGIRLCRGINVLPRRLDWSDSVDVSKSSDIDHDRYSLTVGDIIVAMDRPWIKEGFKLALVEDYDLPALLVQRVARLRPKIASDTVFVYQHLRQPAFQRYCRPTETTIPHISPNEIRAYSVPMPSETLRSDFAERTSRIRHLSKLASTRLANSEKLFAALQHRAFRGEL
jgi:type I restriction enzyme S subunit